MRALTVLGPVPADRLGLSLMHEHLLFDFSMCLAAPNTPEEWALVGQPVHAGILGALRFNPCLVADNLVNRDPDLAAQEALEFVAQGGRTLVDPTNVSIGRDPAGLVAVARATGLHIVMGSGYYYQIALDEAFGRRSLQSIADEIVREVTLGVGETGVRAGLIGEVGTSAPITPSEEKSLRASAQAQARTGAPLMVHLDGWGREGHRVLDLVEAEGGDLGRTVLCHMNPSWFDPSYQSSLADRGAYLEYDMFGIHHFYPPDRASPDEMSAIGAIRALIERGHLRRLLLSQDVYLKMMFRRYGGYGYTHLLGNLRPYFRLGGIAEAELEVMLRDNPQRVLGFLPDGPEEE